MRRHRFVPIRRSTAILAGVCALSLALVESAEAQSRGRVLDASNSVGIAAARVTILDAAGDSLSLSVADAAGAFVVTWPGGPGVYTLRVEALGYQGTSQPIEYEGSPLVVELRVAPDPVELDRLEVEVEPLSPYLDRSGFYQRSQGSTGQFVNLDKADARRFSRTADIFRRVLGVQVEGGKEPYLGRAQGTAFRPGRCYPVIVVDDQIVRTSPTIGDNPLLKFDFVVPRPGDIAAIEVYAGAALAPPQWRTLENNCGVIAIWTKR